MRPGRCRRSLFCPNRDHDMWQEGICELLLDNTALAPWTPASPGTKHSTGTLTVQSAGTRGSPPVLAAQAPRTQELSKHEQRQVYSQAASSSFSPRASPEPPLPFPMLQGLWVPFGNPCRRTRCQGRASAQSPCLGLMTNAFLLSTSKTSQSLAPQLLVRRGSTGTEPDSTWDALGNLYPLSAPPCRLRGAAGATRCLSWCPPCTGGENSAAPPAWGNSPELLRNR